MKKDIPGKSHASFRETARLSLRGFGVWRRETPGLLLSIMLCAVFEALTPYVDIWLMARLIDEIAGGRDPQRLAAYALAWMSASAVLSLLGRGLTGWKNARLSCLSRGALGRKAICWLG